MSKITKLLLLLLLSLTALVSPVWAQDNIIVVGQAIDLSGSNGNLGRDYVAGITTYFDSINATGGIAGKRVRYLVKDDQGNPALSAKLVAELLEKDKADYLLGGIGSEVTEAVLANPRFAQSGQSLYAPLIGTSKNYGNKVLFWRPNLEQEMQYIFSYFDKLGIKLIGLAVQEGGLQREMQNYLLTEIRKRGMQLAGTIKITNNPADFERETQTLAAVNPGIVITLADTVNTGLFLKQFRKHAPRTFVAGSSMVNLEMLAQIAGARSLEWTVFSQVVPNPQARKLMIQVDHANQMKRFRDEDLSSLTFEGYLVGKTLGKAIALSKNGGRDALQVLSNPKSQIDLGGISVGISDNKFHLSNFVDVALFRKGGGLLF